MNDKDKRNVGLRGLMRNTRSPEEIKSDELDQFYKDNIEGKNYTPEVPLQGRAADYIPSVNLMTPKKTEETKNIFGDTEAMKTKKANDWYIRKPVTDADKEAAAFWKADQDPSGKEMLNYVNTMKKKYAAEDGPVNYDKKGYPDKASPTQMVRLNEHLQRSRGPSKDINKQLIALKKTGPNYKYTSKLDQLVDDQILHPKVKTDEYGNPESATDRIQQQDRDRKKRESNSKKKIPNGGTRK